MSIEAPYKQIRFLCFFVRIRFRLIFLLKFNWAPLSKTEFSKVCLECFLPFVSIYLFYNRAREDNHERTDRERKEEAHFSVIVPSFCSPHGPYVIRTCSTLA